MKIIFRFLLAILGIFAILNSIHVFFISNIAFGSFMELFLGGVFFAYGIWFNKINSITKKGFLKIIKILFFIGIIILFAMLVLVSTYGLKDTVNYKEDALIVLGGAVEKDVPSKLLRLRLNKAIAYNHKNPHAYIVVTGSQGPQETVTEAYAMEKYLINHGVSKDIILKEEKATSTYENFIYSKKILDTVFKSESDYKIAFATNDFHVFRAKRLAKYAGFDATYLTSPTDTYLKPTNYLRECAAIVKLILIRK